MGITIWTPSLYYFGPGSYWLNSDRRQYAYPWGVYEADAE